MGTTTTKKYFYLPALGASGQSELDLYNAAQERADSQLPIFPQAYATGTGTSGDPWAGSCIEDALVACPAGGTIFLKAGYYLLSDVATITKTVNIIGAGIGKTFIVTADAHGFEIDGYSNPTDYTTIKNMTIDGDAQVTDGTYRCGIAIGYSDYVVVKNVEVKNAGSLGIDTNSCRYMLMQDIYAHDSVYSHGIHSGTDTSGYNAHNTYRNIYCWDNGKTGFDDRGNTTYPDEDSYNLYDNIRAWGNTLCGITVFSQHDGIISNCYITGNGSKGLNVWDIENFNIHDCYIDLNGEEGIFLRYSDNNSFTNVISKNNSVLDDYYGGINILDSNGTMLTSCQFYDDRGTPLQRYGVMTEDTVDYVNIVNCKLSPNLFGTIHNGASAVIRSTEGIVGSYTAVAGDMQYHNGTNWVRLAKGTEGQVLTMGASVPEWATP